MVNINYGSALLGGVLGVGGSAALYYLFLKDKEPIAPAGYTLVHGDNTLQTRNSDGVLASYTIPAGTVSDHLFVFAPISFQFTGGAPYGEVTFNLRVAGSLVDQASVITENNIDEVHGHVSAFVDGSMVNFSNPVTVEVVVFYASGSGFSQFWGWRIWGA